MTSSTTRRGFVASMIGGSVSLGVLRHHAAAQTPATESVPYKAGQEAGAYLRNAVTKLPQRDPNALTQPETPVAIYIADAAVDAEVEVTQIVNGQMQDPSGPWIVSWYDGTGLIGEPQRNMLMAGHVDYWDVGPAVFRSVAGLQPGAIVTLYGDRGAVANYAVEYVERVNNREMTEAKLQEITGLTGYDALTLITCGGQFDYAAGEYIERDIIRCRLQDITATDTAGAVTPVATAVASPEHARPNGQPSRITEDSINLRAEASVNSDVVAVLAKDTVVTITGEPVEADGFTWYPVTTDAGESGWVVKDYLEIPE